MRREPRRDLLQDALFEGHDAPVRGPLRFTRARALPQAVQYVLRMCRDRRALLPRPLRIVVQRAVSLELGVHGAALLQSDGHHVAASRVPSRARLSVTALGRRGTTGLRAGLFDGSGMWELHELL